jgi:hypothetical protein
VTLFFGNFESRMAFDFSQVATITHEYSYLNHPHVTLYYTSEGSWETINDDSSDAVRTDINAVLAEHRNKINTPADDVGPVTAKL